MEKKIQTFGDCEVQLFPNHRDNSQVKINEISEGKGRSRVGLS